MGYRRNLRPSTNELKLHGIKNMNHLVSFLHLSSSLPPGAAKKLFAGLIHCKRSGLLFQLSVSTHQSLKPFNPSKSQFTIYEVSFWLPPSQLYCHTAKTIKEEAITRLCKLRLTRVEIFETLMGLN